MHVIISTQIPEADFSLLLDALRPWHLARPSEHAPVLFSLQLPEPQEGGLPTVHGRMEPDWYLVGALRSTPPVLPGDPDVP
jgi:hypothetical protein